MPSRSIYPSIPAPGNSLQSMGPCLEAVRQALNMIIINAQEPNTNFAPSSAAQIFVTKRDLTNIVAPKLSPNAAFINLPVHATSDAAAAALGVNIGGIYRTGSALMVRVS
jgi:hypothetical protein